MMLHDIWLPLVVLLAVTCSLLVRSQGGDSYRRLPPSPSGAWPIIGHSHLLVCQLPHRRLMEVANKYGPLVHLRLFSTPVVVVSSVDMLREFFQVHDAIMASRPAISGLLILGFNGNDIASQSYTDRFHELRKVFTRELLSRKRLNELQAVRRGALLQGIESIFYRAKKSSNSSVSMGKELKDTSINSVTQMLISRSYFGPKFESDVQSDEFSRLLEDATSLAAAFDIGDYIPFLKPFDLQGNLKKMRQTNAWFDRFFEKIFTEHRTSTTSRASGVKNFLDSLFDLQRKEGLSDLVLKALLYDFLAGATESSSTSLEWLMAELQVHPEAMMEIHKELDEVGGRNRLVDESDIPNLKYLQACVKESMRLHPPLPLLIPHASTESCTIAGYHIPAKVQVVVNLAAIHLNPQTYEEPEKFRPERFLAGGPNSRMELKGQHFDLVPFGTGRRICPGMNLGLLMVHMGAALLLQSYDWKLPAGLTPESVDMSEAFGTVARKKVPLWLVPTPRLPAHVYAAENIEMGE